MHVIGDRQVLVPTRIMPSMSAHINGWQLRLRKNFRPYVVYGRYYQIKGFELFCLKTSRFSALN